MKVVSLIKINFLEDVQTLKNLRIFQRVDYEFFKNKDEVNILFHLKEKWTVLPILKVGAIEKNFWVELGVIDHNIRGSRCLIRRLLPLLRKTFR